MPTAAHKKEWPPLVVSSPNFVPATDTFVTLLLRCLFTVTDTGFQLHSLIHFFKVGCSFRRVRRGRFEASFFDPTCISSTYWVWTGLMGKHELTACFLGSRMEHTPHSRQSSVTYSGHLSALTCVIGSVIYCWCYRYIFWPILLPFMTAALTMVSQHGNWHFTLKYQYCKHRRQHSRHRDGILINEINTFRKSWQSSSMAISVDQAGCISTGSCLLKFVVV